MSATAEVVTPGTAPVGHKYQRINVSVLGSFLADLESHGYIYIEDIERSKDKYPVLSHLMLPNDAKSALFYSIQGVDEVIGFLVVTTTGASHKIINRYESIPVIAKCAQKVSTLLNFTELTKRSKELEKKNKFK